MRKTIGLMIGLMSLIMAIQFPLQVYGTQVRSVESEGSIGFTGTYEPIGPPDPPPSTSPQKPGGTLPKTNMTDSSLGMWIGSFLVAGVLLVVGSKKRKAISKN
ncbi:LPXTG cell wall anchor domain-containing protein [Enterococcus mundtii]|uniref:LPXTG cell wall anchor domain-containing protein n=1 Tax=Enterococcus mundtii TaxID=53346 RepID=UPI000E00F166|nr:LPXTG cell wall anchor domain-containing protein [Enterococcus mundtii]STD21735.1 LPXTG-domain-containing protein cell wall anchor domain protein [Enterococcus mundtii]